jgi:hypothetical protein
MTMIEQLGVKNGEHRRIDCPACSGTNTLSVSKERGEILYHCFKANCKLSGRKNVGLSAEDLSLIVNGGTKPEDLKVDTPFSMPNTWVPITQNKLITDFMKNFNAYEAYVNGYTMFYDHKLNRIVFPSYINGKIVGAAGRWIGKFSKELQFRGLTKWYMYSQSGYPCVINPLGYTGPAVVVEDGFSAASLSRVAKSYALFGTNLTDKTKFMLANEKKVLICLDNDATKKGLQIARQLSSYVETDVVSLPDDAKYLSQDELRKALKDYL